MSDQTASAQLGTPPMAPGLRATARQLSSYWWVGLAAGIAWIVSPWSSFSSTTHQ